MDTNNLSIFNTIEMQQISTLSYLTCKLENIDFRNKHELEKYLNSCVEEDKVPKFYSSNNKEYSLTDLLDIALSFIYTTIKSYYYLKNGKLNKKNIPRIYTSQWLFVNCLENCYTLFKFEDISSLQVYYAVFETDIIMYKDKSKRSKLTNNNLGYEIEKLLDKIIEDYSEYSKTN